jgi:thymidylate synthase
MVEYQKLISKALTLRHYNKTSPNRPGRFTVFGTQIHHDLDNGFPLITSRDMSRSLNAIWGELFWIMSGDTNAHTLRDKYGVKLWERWATADTSEKLGYKDGALGPIYGEQLRNQNGVDQLMQIIGMLKRNPNASRAIINYWNLNDIEIDGVEKVFIAPCIATLHFFYDQGRLNLHMFQRSVDLMVGFPFDFAQYSLFLLLIAREVGMTPGLIVHTGSDAHVYEDQEGAAKVLLTRTPRSLPTITIKNHLAGNILNHIPGDIVVNEYDPHPAIKNIPVAI